MVSDHLFDGGGIEWSLACKKAPNNKRIATRVLTIFLAMIDEESVVGGA